jgi:hypothetical protein
MARSLSLEIDVAKFAIERRTYQTRVLIRRKTYRSAFGESSRGAIKDLRELPV